MTTVLLVRHGETTWNRDRRFQGHADPPLSEEGRRQAEELAGSLAGTLVAAIYTSDLRRANETAEIVAARLGVPVVADARLRENDIGSWTGLTVDEAAERFPEDFRRWQAGEGFGWQDGEQFPAMAERVLSAVREIAARHPEERVLVVTHAGPVRAIRAYAAGLDYFESRKSFEGLGNCELCEVELAPV